MGWAWAWGSIGHLSQGLREWSSRQAAGLLSGSTEGRGGSSPDLEG